MPLTVRDEEILRHVARYRVTTTESLRRIFFPDSKPGSEKNVLRRLIGEHLQSQPLYSKKVYYQLTQNAAKALGESEECATPFGPQALVRLYGVMAFCCLANTQRQVFTKAEFIQKFTSFGELLDLGQNHFYLDYDGKTARLGQIIVDQGGEYQRLINKCRRLIERGREFPGFQEIISNELFVIAIVLTENSKREMLYAQLRKNPLPVWCRVEVVSDLGNLMPHPE
jgi:hypothetical protein